MFSDVIVAPDVVLTNDVPGTRLSEANPPHPAPKMLLAKRSSVDETRANFQLKFGRESAIGFG